MQVHPYPSPPPWLPLFPRVKDIKEEGLEIRCFPPAPETRQGQSGEAVSAFTGLWGTLFPLLDLVEFSFTDIPTSCIQFPLLFIFWGIQWLDLAIFQGPSFPPVFGSIMCQLQLWAKWDPKPVFVDSLNIQMLSVASFVWSELDSFHQDYWQRFSPWPNSGQGPLVPLLIMSQPWPVQDWTNTEVVPRAQGHISRMTLSPLKCLAVQTQGQQKHSLFVSQHLKRGTCTPDPWEGRS